jgi:hypothetical protein
MRYAKTTQRGFLLLEVSEASAKGSFIFTPSVRDTTYVPVCDAAFEVTPSGATLKAPSGRDDSASSHSSFTGTTLLNMKPSPCVSLPDSLFLGEGRDGYAGAVRVSSLRKTHDPADRSERDPEGVSPLVVIATATACALVGTLVGHYLPKKQNRKTAWRYLEVNGDNASARYVFPIHHTPPPRLPIQDVNHFSFYNQELAPATPKRVPKPVAVGNRNGDGVDWYF